MRGRSSYLKRNALSDLGAALLAIVVWIPSTATSESGQETPTTSTDTVSAESLSSKEQELRRKEEELLNSMGLQASLSASDGNSSENASQPSLASKDEILENDLVSQKTGSRLQYLKTMGQHPALEQRKLPPTLPTPVPRIKTYGKEGSLGESTAKRLDTFRRTDNFGIPSNEIHYPSKRAISVSLDELHQEAATRSASLNRPEVATIGISAVKLRSAPTTRNAVITNLPRFSEVAIDYRSGDWYRVQTTSGQRGWVKGGALLFDAGISTSSAVRIGAVSHVPEAHASP